MPQERSERTEYICACSPKARREAKSSWTVSRAGVTTRSASEQPCSVSATSRCQPSGKPCREVEAGTAAQRPVEVEGRRVVLGLLQIAPIAVLETQMHLHGGTVIDMDGNGRGAVLSQHGHRRERAGPWLTLAGGADSGDVLLGAHFRAERAEDRVQGGVGDILLGAVPPPILGADAEVAGEISQH